MISDTSVLFLIFNRPELAARVFQEVRRAKPKRLYIAADGPRKNIPGDVNLCRETRHICNQIDWDCEVKTLFREDNLGCQLAVSSAIDWFFRYEEEGIILEDDCLPGLSFFRYCTDLLEYYRDDALIMSVSGNNFQQRPTHEEDSYYFSRYHHCWGWATWRNSWLLYDAEMDNWVVKRNTEIINQWSDATDKFCKYWETVFDVVVNGKVDSWSYRWLYTCWKHRGLACLPQKNLVRNIGFAETATHTHKNETWNSMLEHNDLSFPLQHPQERHRNIKADKYTDRNVFGIVNAGDEQNKSLIGKIVQWFGSRFR